MLRRGLAVTLFLSTIVGLTGCGGASRPALGYVSGIVTLDGEPLPGVIIVLKPDEGRMATAITDAKGFYDIEYVKGEKGTKIGPNTVSFEWPLGATATKPLPPSYASGMSTHKIEVKSGKQTNNIELETEGAAAKVEPASTDSKSVEKPD